MNGKRSSGSPLGEADLLPETRRQVLAVTGTAGVMTAQLVFGKAARDALFLSTFEVSLLPAAMIGAAALSAIAVLTVSRAMTRHSPAHVVPWMFGVSALLFVGEWFLGVWAVRLATAVFYVHMGAFGATVISSFWSLVNERFDPHTAKRVIGRIASGGTLGGIGGSVIAWRASASLGSSGLFLLLAGLNALCFLGTLGLRATTKAHDEAPPSGEPVASASGFSFLRHTPYLRQLAWLVGIAGVTSSLIDYVLAARAATFASGASLLTFFAILHMSIALVGFVVQVLLTPVSLDKLGVSGTVTTLPVAVIGAGITAFALPGVATVIALRSVEAVVQNSLFRSGYELFYTPIAEGQKRSLKLIIDVGFERAGIAVGSAITMLVIWLLPDFAERLLLGGIVLTAGVGVMVVRRLHAGYVSSLEESMRARTEHLEEAEQAAGTQRPSFTQTDRLVLDNSEIPRRPAASTSGSEGRDRLLDSITQLRSGDAANIRRVLSVPSIDTALVAHLIPLLARDDVARDVVASLRSVAPRVSGQLIDTLLDPSVDVVVRRRIPRVLRRCDSRLAVAGLTSALADGVFDIRHQCGLALLSITDQKPDLSPTEADVIAAVLREVAADKATWDSQRLQEALADDDDGHTDDIMRERSRSLEHVFTLLSLVHEREPLKLAFQALGCEDDRLRGTALEYLENVLSPEIRERLWTYLGDLREYQRSERSRSELLDELRRLAVSRGAA